MIGLALAALILAQASPSPPPSANAILFHALGRLRSYGTPPYVVYLAEENGTTHRIAFRGADEMMNDTILPQPPVVPPARLYRAFVGPLAFSVHEALATPTPAPQSTPASTTPSTNLETALKTIAVVSSHGRLYDVFLVGTQTLDDRATYHIALHPLRDPDRNAIRDFWIDTQTYDVVRADYVYAHPPDFEAPGAEADLTVNFATVGPYRIAARWIAIYHAPDLAKPVYRELRVVKMRFPETLPDWLFDPALYVEHRRAHDADPLAGLFDNP